MLGHTISQRASLSSKIKEKEKENQYKIK